MLSIINLRTVEALAAKMGVPVDPYALLRQHLYRSRAVLGIRLARSRRAVRRYLPVDSPPHQTLHKPVRIEHSVRFSHDLALWDETGSIARRLSDVSTALHCWR